MSTIYTLGKIILIMGALNALCHHIFKINYINEYGKKIHTYGNIIIYIIMGIMGVYVCLIDDIQKIDLQLI